MSLDMMILDPVNHEERRLFYPICGEGSYDSFLLPLSRRYDLDMIFYWHPFLHVDKSNFGEFTRQMEVLIGHIHDASDNGEITLDTKKYFDDRLYGLIDTIRNLLNSRSDMVVSIG